MDRRGERPPQSRRDPDQGVSVAPLTRRRRPHPAPLLPADRLRHGARRSWRCSSRTSAAGWRGCRSAGRPAAALRAQGEEHHLPVHGGGPSQLDLFDPSRSSRRCDGERSRRSSSRASASPSSRACRSSSGAVARSGRHGRRGADLSERLPHLARRRRRHRDRAIDATDQFNHAPAQLFMTPGRRGRPASMGSWLTYGLGSENRDLPGFVVLCPASAIPGRGRRCGAAAFCRASTRASSSARRGPVLVPLQPRGREPATCGGGRSTRSRVEPARSFDDFGDPEIVTRIAAYEMAYRMQTSVPELIDIAGEPRHDPRAVRHAAGQELVREQLPAGAAAGRARRALRAALPPGLGPPRRRRGEDLATELPKVCRETDRPAPRWSRTSSSAGCSTRPGHLGRRVRRHADERGARRPAVRGRDHHPRAFMICGRRAAGTSCPGSRWERPTSSDTTLLRTRSDVHDLHATYLELTGPRPHESPTGTRAGPSG